MSDLKVALVDKVEELLTHMEDNREDNVRLIKDAMKLKMDPTDVFMRATNDWQEFVATLRDNSSELSPWVFTVPAATGLEMVFLNIVAGVWVDNPPATDETLSPVVKDAVDKRVGMYVQLITL